MPKFLVDESTGIKVYEFLLGKGFNTLYVSNIMPRAVDEEVLAFAEKEKRILITNDKDFGELIFRLKRPSSGIVLLRLKRDFPKNRIKYLVYLLDNHFDKIEGNFIVIKEGQIRIRGID